MPLSTIEKPRRPFVVLGKTLGEDAMHLYADFLDREVCKSVPGWRWMPKEKCWSYAPRPETLEQIIFALPGVNILPEVRRAVDEVAQREALATKTKLAGWKDAKPVEPMPVRTKPFQHQIAAFNVALKLPSSGLFLEQGTGKTLTAIAVAGRRFLDGEIQRVLVVAPASVVPVWPKEFVLHAKFPHQVIALEGPVRKRKEVLTGWEEDEGRLQVAVTNYEATWRMEQELARWKPDMIICDESQRIKTPGAKQSRAMHRLGAKTKYRMALTGTPVTQGPLDFFSQYKFLDQGIFGRSYYAFRARYAVMGGFENRQVIGYNRLPELIKKAHAIAFRVTKDEALDLPPVVEQELYCNLEAKAKTLYRQIQKESVAALEGERMVTAANVLTRLLRLSQVTGGFIGDDDGVLSQVSKAKMKLFAETLDDLLSSGKKVVVFARFVPEIRAIRGHLSNKGIDYAWIAGEVKQSERGEMVRRFQEDGNCRVFIAQIQTAGLGITLHAADTAIFYSLDYSYANLDQAMARLHRIGQKKNKVTNIFLLAKGTVDEKVRKVLAGKQDVARAVVDGWREFFEGGR